MLAALALIATGHAFAPTPHDGNEPVRVYRTTPSGQARFIRSDRWQRFLADSGAGWQVRADEQTGVPLRMWGGQKLGPVADADALHKRLEGFIAEHTELLGAIHPVQLRSSATDPDFGITYVEFDTLVDGRPIWRGGLTFRVRGESLVMVGAATYPHTEQRGAFLLSGVEATDAAVAASPAPEAAHTIESAREVWLPLEEDGALVLRAAVEVRSSTVEPRGKWVTHVDAVTGKALASYNEIRHLSGTVEAQHDVRNPGSGTTISPVVGAYVATEFETVVTDHDGVFDLVDGTEAISVLTGDRLVLNDLGGSGPLDVPASGDVLWTAQGDGLAALDTWVFTQRVRDTFNGVVPNQVWTYGDTQLTVNINESCNAYFDGTLNFFTAGSGCANTGRLADVVYHEWGHGLHYYSLLAGDFDGALSEGTGDAVSFLMTGDARLAPGFFSNGAFLRNADNNRVYPDDIVGEVHEDGLIFAGAMWDTLQSIAADRGESEAIDETRHILAGLLKGGPGLENAMVEALVADDDDDDLGNGTPNECSIVQGFAAHGLALGSSGFAADHLPFMSAPADAPIAIETTLMGSERCLEGGADGAVLTWRVDGGDWAEIGLDEAGTDLLGQIPPQAQGSVVEYYVTADTALGPLEAPRGGWRNPFSVYIGDTIPIHCDDFEDGEDGYTHELISGRDEEGADDWQRGRPRGQSGDPDFAHSGTKVWGNDLGRQDFNGAYQDNKHNRLSSPVMELKHYEGAFVQYWRWLRVEDAVYDQASILVNGETVWTNAEGQGEDHHLEEQWVSHSVRIPEGISEAQIHFDLKSDGGLTMGGWTIDDVCLRAPATANNRLGVTDFSASMGLDSGVELEWTNPVHAPLQTVRVVRKARGCPTDGTDGDVVFYDNAPELGAKMMVFDPTPRAREYCYGVFPGDGTDLLGFAENGWNIAEGDAASRAPGSDIRDAYTENGLDDFDADHPEHAGGCGCSTGSAPFGAVWMGALMGLFARRR